MNQKHVLVVVLGMHRSGTSAIARGLMVMGVELGDTLLQGIAHDNPKGYYEDTDVLGLNEEMLSHLGRAWHNVSPVPPGAWGELERAGFGQRAREMLAAKLEEHPAFGLKDPRLCVLLPFWRGVFADCGAEPAYVIALRHPLSVRRSLAKRSDLYAVKSPYLWLGHVLGGLRESAGARRVVVDFDSLMDAPEAHLRRMAEDLGLEVSRDGLAEYLGEYLDNGLRHTVFGPDELNADEQTPTVVGEIYAALLRAQDGELSLDGGEFGAMLTRWGQAAGILAPALAAIDELGASIMAAEPPPITPAEDLAVLQGQVARLGEALAQRDAHVERLTATLEEVYRSNSWRITKPLRDLGRLFSS